MNSNLSTLRRALQLAKLNGPAGAMGSISIYERDDLMYALLQEWLTGAGYCVHDPARPAGSAVQVRLAIVSVVMPREQSEALITWVRRVHPGTPIIALSGRARSGLSSDGLAARMLGVDRVMAKPLVRSELLAAVASLIGAPDRDLEQGAAPVRPGDANVG